MKIVLPDFPLEGGCICGAIRYRLNAHPLSLYACHCRRCQALSGGAYSMSMPCRAQDVEILSGAPAEYLAPADNGRTVRICFCESCATRVWHIPAHSPKTINIKPGTLDDTSWIAPVAHFWVSRMQPGTRVEEGALMIEGQPESREMVYDAWARAIA